MCCGKILKEKTFLCSRESKQVQKSYSKDTYQKQHKTSFILFFLFSSLVYSHSCIPQKQSKQQTNYTDLEESENLTQDTYDNQLQMSQTLDSQVQTDTQEGTNETSQDDVQDETQVTKIDASTLQIFMPSIANLRQADGSLASFLKYDTNGETDYIKYKICPLEDTGDVCQGGGTCTDNGACIENITPQLGLVIPSLYSGNIRVVISACVKSEKALTQQTCGSESSLLYNSNRVNLEVARLLHKKGLYEQQASALILEHKKYLEEWVEQSKTCQEQNTAAETQLNRAVQIVEQFIKGPVEFFPRLIFHNDAVYESVTEPIGDWISGIDDSLAEWCKSKDIDPGDPTCKDIANLGSMAAGFAQGMTNPTAAIGVLIKSIETIQNPETSVPLACNQEQKLASAHFQYQSRKTILVNNYSKIEESLEALESNTE